MKAHIWTNTGPITSHWHSGGGLMIVAENLASARKLWLASDEAQSVSTEDGETAADAVSERPDIVLNLASGKPRIVTFPDSGCC